jgi:hypothetical protein
MAVFRMSFLQIRLNRDFGLILATGRRAVVDPAGAVVR